MERLIRCGWCIQTTKPGRCGSCGRVPEVPYLHRGLTPPEVDVAAERASEQRTRLAVARRALGEAGTKVTNASLAEQLGIDERTVRRWMSAK